MSSEQLSFAPPARPKPRIPYRGHAPHTKGSDTSREAAESIEPDRGTLQYEVLRFFRQRGLYGATDEEATEVLNISGSTYRPRRCELVEMGFVARTDERRENKSGRTATVWVAT